MENIFHIRDYLFYNGDINGCRIFFKKGLAYFVMKIGGVADFIMGVLMGAEQFLYKGLFIL